jgi:hypothetical protein
MRAPDRELLALVTELREAIAAGRKPQLTDGEWTALAAFVETRGKRGRRRGQHKSMTRHIEAAHRRMLRNIMEHLKTEQANDPAELELKRAMRANGGRYVLNERVAERMHQELQHWDPVPSVAALKNILSRSNAGDREEEPWY